MGSYPAISVGTTLNNADSLKIQAWDKVLQEYALAEDIFFTFGGNYQSTLKSIPNAIYMKVPQMGNEANKVNFPLLMPLAGDPEYGTGTDPLSNAEQQSLKYMTAYYNDYDKSVKGSGFGIEYLNGAPYGLMEKVTPQLQMYLKELMGYWIRYAMLNGFSPNLFFTPVSLSSVPHPTTLVQGVPLADQPAENYQSNAAFMASIIASSFSQVPAGTAGAMDFNFLDNALSYVTYQKPMLPLSVNGESVYISTIPTSQVNRLLDPSNTEGLGTIWQAVSRFSDQKKANFPLALGQFKNCILIEDPRAPVAKAYGTGSGSNTASASNAIYVDAYMKPGLNDQRTSLGTTDVMEASFIMGRGAFVDLEPEPVHFEGETQYLGKLYVKGALGSRGFTRTDYDNTTKSNTSVHNQSSAVLWSRKQVQSFA